jgi:Fe-S cluster assembly iron-binding protein IscA
MALDEPKEGDLTFERKGLMFLIDRDLYETVKPIEIDYLVTERDNGFVIKSSLPSCGSCCS